MRKPLTTIVAGLLFCFSVNAQHIPDKNFADAIRKTCSDCIDMNNDLLPAAQKLRNLDLRFDNIENLEGVEGFSSLDDLNCSHNEHLTVLNKLPTTLIELECYETGINNIVYLPPNLKNLICRDCPITSLPALPTTLEELDCTNTGLTMLPSLPESLIILYLNNSPINSLPKLPGKLRFLYIANTKITSLPALPTGLASIVISDNVFDCIAGANPDLSIDDINLNPSKTTFCKGYPNQSKVVEEIKPFQPEGKCISGNCINGIGTYVSKKGSTYKGSFKDGMMDGKGTLISLDATYTGEWKKNYPEGAGTTVFKNGKKSTGIWKEGKLWSGTGYFDYGEKGFYYGAVKENMPDGQGVYNFPNGKNFTGSFSKGNAVNGKGYIQLDKSSYEGTFVNGKLSGMGIYTNTYGQIFSGNFVDGDLNGNGKMIGTDVEQYDGNFKNTLPDGYGVLKLKDGRVYKGNWTDGKQNGNGSSYDANGKLVYSGEWSNGKRVDQGNADSDKKELWENVKKIFSRGVFKGHLNSEDINVKITDVYYINNDYTLTGTHLETFIYDGDGDGQDDKYLYKCNFTGTYNPITHKIDIVFTSTILKDELPGNMSWKLFGISATIYDLANHPGYFVIKGDDSGEEFQETDYYDY